MYFFSYDIVMYLVHIGTCHSCVEGHGYLEELGRYQRLDGGTVDSDQLILRSGVGTRLGLEGIRDWMGAQGAVTS